MLKLDIHYFQSQSELYIYYVSNCFIQSFWSWDSVRVGGGSLCDAPDFGRNRKETPPLKDLGLCTTPPTP